MLIFSTIGAGDMPSFPTAAFARLYGRMGWRLIASGPIRNGTAPDQNGYIWAMDDARLRWRGRGSAGLGLENMLSRQWNDRGSDYRVAPMPFADNEVRERQVVVVQAVMRTVGW